MNDKKPKVIFVLGSLRMGGAERMMINLANRLNNRTDTTLIRLLQGDDLKNELDPALRVISFSCRRALNSFFPLIGFIKKERPDVMISTQIHINIICMFAVLFSGQRVKVILREATTPGIHFNLNKGLRSSITRLLMKWIYPRADAVVVNTVRAGKDLIENKFVEEEKVSVIYNPVVLENFNMRLHENITHPFFGQAPVFISVGRLARQKNYAHLIRAFAEVLKKKDARLIIVGEGPDRDEICSLISEMKSDEKISLTGQINNPYPLLRQSDVFVLSSLYEGLPNALIEAMACGIQVVSTDSPGGSREILMDGKLGNLVPVNDVEALATAMLNALEKKVPADELVKSTERFDGERIASMYFSLIKKICNG